MVGFELTGKMMEGTTGTDLGAEGGRDCWRKKGVVGKFVEFYGAGLDTLPLADRATIANMAPEYGATCGFFSRSTPKPCATLRNTGRDEDTLALVEAYAKENGFWRRGADYAPVYTDTLSLDMGTIVPAISGPKRPQDYIRAGPRGLGLRRLCEGLCARARDATAKWEVRWEGEGARQNRPSSPATKRHHARGYVDDGKGGYQLHDGSIVIASITSCTNTSNPYVMIGGGACGAQGARARG